MSIEQLRIVVALLVAACPVAVIGLTVGLIWARAEVGRARRRAQRAELELRFEVEASNRWRRHAHLARPLLQATVPLPRVTVDDFQGRRP